ncbi:hypothetical protein LENED_003137 [Lentinula edodes]|uniref:Uncharacterized protein n=1 Tax=Lentinula edodes TaxID=5353 RepID=A0A1Q3E2R6_LENED|nr:hypothetical protein LENED_003137 [Lentinula edodes]
MSDESSSDSPIPSSSILLEEWLNGFYLLLVCVTLWALGKNKHYKRSLRYALPTVVILQYVFSTMHSVTHWVYLSTAVDLGEAQSGDEAVSNILLESLTHVKPWQVGVRGVSLLANGFLADGLILWRAWVVWGQRWIVIVVPMICSLGAVALSIAAIPSAASADNTLSNIESNTFIILNTAAGGLSIVTSITGTSLIIIKIIGAQRLTAGVFPNRRNRYNGAIEIIAESAVLYSITLLSLIVCVATKDTNTFYALNIHAQVAGIAPLLIILRAAAGYSRPDSVWSSSAGVRTGVESHKVPSGIRFRIPESHVTLDFAGEPGQGSGQTGTGEASIELIQAEDKQHHGTAL